MLFVRLELHDPEVSEIYPVLDLVLETMDWPKRLLWGETWWKPVGDPQPGYGQVHWRVQYEPDPSDQTGLPAF